MRQGFESEPDLPPTGQTRHPGLACREGRLTKDTGRLQETRHQNVTPWFLTCLLLLVFIGTCFRLTYLHGTFFTDEIWVAEFVSSRHYEPHAIPSPPLFFYLVKWLMLAFTAFIHGEALFRIAPFVSGILLMCAPLCFYPLIQSMVDRATAAVWTFLLSFSSPLIFYSARLKQYTLEALSAAVLISLFVYVAQDMPDVRRWRIFLLTSVFFVCSLHSPIFILVSAFAGFALMLFTTDRGAPATRRLAARHLMRTYVWIFLAFLFAYYGYLKPGPKVTEYFGDLEQYFSQSGQQYWFDGSFGFLYRMSKLWVGQMFNLAPLFLVVAGISTAYCVFVGGSRLFTHALALVCGLPALVVLTASAFHLYPYGEVRLMIFAAPGLYLIVARAFSQMLASRHAPIRYGACIACGAVLFSFTVNGFSDTYNVSYMKTADMRAVYGVLLERHRPGEKVFVERSDAYALGYYLPLLKREVVVMNDTASEFDPGRGPARRVWVLENRARPFVKADAPASYSERQRFQYEHYVLILYERVT